MGIFKKVKIILLRQNNGIKVSVFKLLSFNIHNVVEIYLRIRVFYHILLLSLSKGCLFNHLSLNYY